MSYQMTISKPSANEIAPQSPLPTTSTEVVPKAKRRSFSAEYKRRILREADSCREQGQIGALLRREGLYSSHLANWRKQAAIGQLTGSKNSHRGRYARQSAEQKEIVRLRRENERLKKQVRQAELIIEAQKKVADLLDLISQGPQEQP